MEPMGVRRLRSQLGWTQRKLAQRLGVSQPLVSAWESGRRRPGAPEQRLLEQLAAQAGDAKGPAVRDRILRAAVDALAREGARGLSFRALGREIGLTRTGVEHHFPTREALLAALLAGYREALDHDLAARMARFEQAGEPAPRTSAYLSQALDPPDPVVDPRSQRAAALAAVDATGRTRAALAEWYRRGLEAAAEEHADVDGAMLDLLAVDALWAFSLLGWLALPPERVHALHRSARARLQANGP